MTGIVEQDQPEGRTQRTAMTGFGGLCCARGALPVPWVPLHCSTLPKQSPSALDVSMSAPNDTAGTGAPTHPGIQWSKIVSRDALHTSIHTCCTGLPSKGSHKGSRFPHRSTGSRSGCELYKGRLHPKLHLKKGEVSRRFVGSELRCVPSPEHAEDDSTWPPSS